jgi:outer membrane protein OmpA-like peptidoglycan-associated protein
MAISLMRTLIAATLAAGSALALPLVTRAADAEEIVRALMPKPKGPITRSFQPSPARGIAVEGGDFTEEAAPTIDLYVHFEFDSSKLTMTDARNTVDTLGKALTDKRLSNMRFMIIGHTDARGSDEYNLALSRNRAEAVRARLMQFSGVSGDRLVAEGRGRRELKDASRPEDGVNRRVQIITISDKIS